MLWFTAMWRKTCWPAMSVCAGISRPEQIPIKKYGNCTAAVLRAKECVLKTATTIQENAEDIYAEAQQINEERAAKDAEEYTDVEDVEEAEETAEEASEENEAK